MHGFSDAGFIPHGHCYLWDPALVGLMIGADSLIALAYFSIPVTLGVYYVRRGHTRYDWVLLLFAGFIMACGATHLMQIYTLWVPNYWAEGAVKAGTAAISLATAAMLWPLLPRVLALPSPHQLHEANRRLEREIAERRASDVRSRLLVESIPNALVIVDEQGRITEVNSQTTRWFGYSREELIGRSVDVLVPERIRGPHAGYREGYAANATVRPMGTGRELFGLRRDGTEFPVDISLSPIRTERGLEVIAAVVDVTERKRAEAEIRSANVALASVNQELESFAYSVSHDLRAPLRAMSGFSHALLEDYEPRLDEQGKDYLRRIDRAVERMRRLIDDLLTLSRINRGDIVKEVIDLSGMAHEILRELREQEPAREADIRIEEGLRGEGDPDLLRVALQNLLGNAWKFTRNTARTRIVVGVEPNGEGAAFFVRDNGVGFDMAYANKLFTPFQRLHTEAEFSGTGIGLAIVQRVLARHGGRVWAESRVGEGAVFRFTL